ncbi:MULTISPECIES: large conductance mechanosensitive channel protein MscL [Antrihabitans]|jgi:large conductance mechanosensitive channel|uniref:Large-conductance mechanosensitive channel n=2 Tax=Antrihabitans TaxID=2799491 RepID=A0A934U580_9NOCA|nr:large conductance mechanosensitive channel protein MscL [Antrihabitans stalagmiti]MBJ8340548.1 large conductance mechanosensitive channel protein MscL [Antrihabitans stalagmiti]
MLKGFKEFILKGNVIDLAVAVVMGTAFTAIVTAFTNSIINPLIARLGGGGTIGLGFQLGTEGNEKTFVNLGTVITAGINFLIVAAVLYFILVLPVTKLKDRKKAEGDDAEGLTDSEVLVQIRDILAGGANTPAGSPEGKHGL